LIPAPRKKTDRVISADGGRTSALSSIDMAVDGFGGALRFISFMASLLAFIVGLIHLIRTMDASWSELTWSDGGFIDEVNKGWQSAFELTPQAIVTHWQPLIIGWIALAHHVRYVHSLSVYHTWVQMAFWYIFVALWGCFGYCGNLGIIAGALALLASCIAVAMAIVDRGGAADAELL
jgi:hypothetical protein